MGDAFVIQIKISIVDRDHPGHAGPALPGLGVRLAGPDAGRTPDGPPVDPAGARCSSRIGVAIAYFILPFAIAVPVQLHRRRRSSPRTAAGPYFDFVTTLFLVFGLIMEFPILLVGLSRVGIVTSERLRSPRRMIILGIAIFAAVATPGGDLVSPIVLGGTMYVLFELTILFIRRSGR